MNSKEHSNFFELLIKKEALGLLKIYSREEFFTKIKDAANYELDFKIEKVYVILKSRTEIEKILIIYNNENEKDLFQMILEDIEFN